MAEISGLQLPHVGCDPYGDGDISCTHSLCTFYIALLYIPGSSFLNSNSETLDTIPPFLARVS